ncbi:carbohydrate kinase family protein [Radicibacter daui]|uniref:carbohydrate kinase family protein n=1 Tax=Radicibacter daui TaxID=3064829 RepID=UPI004046EFE9
MPHPADPARSAFRHSLACIGAANIDRKLMLLGPAIPATTNACRITTTDGGVARNVAENAARLGAEVAFFSRLGQENEADGLLARLAEAGVDVAPVLRIAGAATASYNAVLDHEGELVIAPSDMTIYDGWSAAECEAALPALARHKLWLMDTNAPEATLRWLVHNRPQDVSLIANGASLTKMARLLTFLEGIDLVFCNRDEAGALIGKPLKGAGDLRSYGDWLLDSGVGAGVVTWGKEGAWLIDRQGTRLLPAPKAKVVDVTGAGDSLVAGALVSLARGDTLENAVRFGQALASLTVEAEKSVRDDLTLADVAARMAIAP